MRLRRGNATSNTAADHITALRRALNQLPADNTAATARGARCCSGSTGPGRPTSCSTGSLRAG
jgi:hypothetical protein